MSTIAFIGTGIMGASMVGHLLDAGHELRVHTRTRSRAEHLIARGAHWAATPAEAADGAAMAISIVGMPEDVEEVHLGPSGTLAAASPPALLIDMTTSRPTLAQTIARCASERGIGALDAPVSGGDVGARNATLSIMVGGSVADFTAALPVLERLGKTIVRHGGPGCGQHAKMVNQILIAAGMMGVCEGLLYAQRAGLDGQRVIQSVSVGAAGSWSIANLGPRILREDWAPGFRVDHFLKDLGIALEEAARLEVPLPATAQATRLYRALHDRGHAGAGTQALFLRYMAMVSGDDAHPSSAV